MEERVESSIPRRFIQINAEQATAMAADYETGIRVKDLPVKYNVSRGTISKHLRRQAISPRKVGLGGQQIKEAAWLYAQGDSLETIGKKMSVSAQTVRSRLIETGVTMRSSYEHLLKP